MTRVKGFVMKAGRISSTFAVSFIVFGMFIAAASAYGAEAARPFIEAFDDEQADVVFGFKDNKTANPNQKPWEIKGGQAVFSNESDYKDVGTVLVKAKVPAKLTGFSVSSKFHVYAINYSGPTRVGLVALGDQPVDQRKAGLYAFVEAVEHTSGKYRVGLAVNQTVVATSETFDLTDKTPDFTLTLRGKVRADGQAALKIVFEDAGGENKVPALTHTLPVDDLPKGSQFGARLQPGYNKVVIGIDDLTIGVTDQPDEPAS